MQAISLFTGIGGFEIALNQVFGSEGEVVQMVEVDPDAQSVLRSHFPHTPIYPDICAYYPNINWNYTDGLVFGGFPCTNTSCAGDRTGLQGAKSSLWFEMLRVIAIARPRFVLVENPTGLIHRGLRAMLGGFSLAGYSTEVEIISAEQLGAPHERERLFVVAYPNYLCQGQDRMPPRWDEQIRAEIEAIHSQGRQAQPIGVGVDDGIPQWLGGISLAGKWRDTAHTTPVYAGVRRHMAKRRNCVDLYGRSVVPACAAVAFRRIKFLEEWWRDV
ncbi:MAG: DNA cytosine methyltransferase [Nostoc sp. ChiSLP01]|nr:DNA (cytosine-5-)-methyltransferase [Nostoc sp. CmiSLP01]MDZ8285239.1 DNA (cytosine-5-)-methyltransferase [Nostoc sp. ChiSLP01]